MPLHPAKPASALNCLTLWFNKRAPCPACSLRRILDDFRNVRRGASTPQRVRYASTLASSTAIHAVKNIPPKFNELHKALKILKKDATNYVDLSKLDLAIRSLETTDPVVRIAVLGLQGPRAAKRLARLIAADPLGPREEWEDRLMMRVDPEYIAGQGLLMSYGPQTDISSSRSAVPLLRVPSPFLQQYNIEIFVSTINPGDSIVEQENSPRKLQTTALVPMVTTRGSFAGNVSMIRHPVHRALIVGEGLSGCAKMAPWLELTKDEPMPSSRMTTLAVDLPSMEQAEGSDEFAQQVNVVDLDLAEKSLDLFRISNENASIYGEDWLKSGLQALTQWAKDSSHLEGSPLKPAIRSLINDMIEETQSVITEKESNRLNTLVLSPLRQGIVESLDQSISDWAQKSHTELRDSLESAYASASWVRLKWWKLFWRVDDVTMILEDLLDRKWLIQSEKGVYWLAGRVQESGVTDEDMNLIFDETLPKNLGLKPINESTNWPLNITSERRQIKAGSISKLQGIAQTLTFQTFSTTTLSSAFSATMFLTVPSCSIYEAGAIAALGFVWSMRRMQRIWEAWKKSLQSELEERGRIVLRQTEEMIRFRIAETGKRGEDVDGSRDRQLASQAVDKAREAFKDLLERKRKV